MGNYYDTRKRLLNSNTGANAAPVVPIPATSATSYYDSRKTRLKAPAPAANLVPNNPLTGMIDPAVEEARRFEAAKQQYAQDQFAKALMPFDYNVGKRADQAGIDILDKQITEKKANTAELQKKLTLAVDWPTLADGSPLPAFTALQAEIDAAEKDLAKTQKTRDDARNNLYENKQNLKREDLESVSYTDKDFAAKTQDTAKIIANTKDRQTTFAEHTAMQNNISYLIGGYMKEATEEAIKQGQPESAVHYDHLNYLTPKEKSVLLYYASNNDWVNARKYYELVRPGAVDRQKKEAKVEIADIAHDNPAAGVMLNVYGSLGQPLSAVGILAQNIKNNLTGEYEPVDTNSGWFAGSQIVEATTEGITRDMSGLGKIAAQAGLSLGQYAAAFSLGPGVALAYMGASSAGAAGYDALERGATPEQALQMALAAGATEVITEKIPLDKLLKIFTSGSKGTIKATLLNVAKQQVPEGVEGLVSSYINSIADNAIMADQSQLAGLIKTYIEQGMTEDEATRKALVQTYVANPAISAVSEMAAGSAMAGVGSIGPSQNTVQGRIVKSADAVGDLVQQGPESASDTQSFQLASALQGKLDAGKKVTSAEIGRLVNADEISQPYTDKIPTSVKSTKEVRIERSSIDLAREHIKDAEFDKDFIETPDAFKNNLMTIYKSSGNTREIAVDSGVDGKAYDATVNKSTAEKVISDPNVSAEKLAVLKNIDAIVKNSTYVESGKSTSKSGGRRQTIRHDYFEAPVTIGSEKYAVRFDVALSKGSGNTGARNVISGIDVVKAPEAGGGKGHNIKPDSVPNRRADDVLRAYINQIEMIINEGKNENSAPPLVNGQGEGYNGKQDKLFDKANEGAGKTFTQGSTIPDELLNAKPSHSPAVNKWLNGAGKIEINNGTWKYTNPQGVSVTYKNGYPDFKGSGHVVQEANIGGFTDYYRDFKNADMITGGRMDPINNVWHHLEDGRTLQEVNKQIHMQFTHRGGMSAIKR